MKQLRIFSVPLLLLLPAVPRMADAADSFTLAGKEIRVPVPEGFVRVTGDMPAVESFARQMHDPMNHTLAMYLLASDAPAALRGQIPEMKRYHLLKVNRQTRDIMLGRREFAEMTAYLRDHLEQLAEDMPAAIEDAVAEISAGIRREFAVDYDLKIADPVSFPAHLDTPDHFAFSMIMQVNASSDGQHFQHPVAATASLVNAGGAVLSLYTYAPAEDLAWTRRVNQAWAEDTIKNNDPPPASTRGFFRNISGKNALIGAIIGGVYALFAILRRKPGAHTPHPPPTAS